MGETNSILENGVCQHGSISTSCSDCNTESKPQTIRRNIRLSIEKWEGDNSEALSQLDGLSDPELTEILNKAILQASDPDNMDSLHIGGNFVTEDGQDRRRRLMALKPEGLSDQYKFLNYLALKITPDTKYNRGEIKIHRSIQDTVSSENVSEFDVPIVVQEQVLQDGRYGLVVERLFKDHKNETIQQLLKDGPDSRTRVMLGDDVAQKIIKAINRLNQLGYRHGDINEGNFFLRNISLAHYDIPEKPGQIRPKKIAVAVDADITLLDFEKSEPFPTGEIDDEDSAKVKEMLRPITIEIYEGYAQEEVLEAVDDFFGQKRKAA